MKNLEKQYADLLAMQRFRTEELGEAVIERHVAELSSSPLFAGSALSIFDLHGCRHVYESEYHKRLFADTGGCYTGMRIHPDDYVQVMKNGVAAMRHVFMNERIRYKAKDFKLIREYRAMVGGAYKRVTEDMQVLETDSRGNVWLVLSIVNISPDQQPPYNVVSQVVNSASGDAFSPLDEFYDRDRILSPREGQILALIGRGMLSKEIAAELHISVNTVNTHRQRILEKLGVGNSIEAVRYAHMLGLLEA